MTVLAEWKRFDQQKLSFVSDPPVFINQYPFMHLQGPEILEEQPAEDQAADVEADLEDDSKYLHGPDFERGEGDPEVGVEEAAVVQASESKLVPSFDEEDPDA